MNDTDETTTPAEQFQACAAELAALIGAELSTQDESREWRAVLILPDGQGELFMRYEEPRGASVNPLWPQFAGGFRAYTPSKGSPKAIFNALDNPQRFAKRIQRKLAEGGDWQLCLADWKEQRARYDASQTQLADAIAAMRALVGVQVTQQSGNLEASFYAPAGSDTVSGSIAGNGRVYLRGLTCTVAEFGLVLATLRGLRA